jgi:uncharacterized protein
MWRLKRGNAPPALAVFARAPVPRRAKTRLIPLFGPRGAAEFHAALVSDTLQKVNKLGNGVAPYFFLAGGRYPVSSSLSDYKRVKQRGADLGKRLEHAFHLMLARHPSALIIGTDSPLLPWRVLDRALGKLRSSDAVLGPCPDGGFYAIGLQRLEAGLFDQVRWGSSAAFEDVREKLAARNFSCTVLQSVEDVDRPEDVVRLCEKFAKSREARFLAPCAWRFLKDFLVLKGARRGRSRNKAGAPPPDS